MQCHERKKNTYWPFLASQPHDDDKQAATSASLWLLPVGRCCSFTYCTKHEKEGQIFRPTFGPNGQDHKINAKISSMLDDDQRSSIAASHNDISCKLWRAKWCICSREPNGICWQNSNHSCGDRTLYDLSLKQRQILTSFANASSSVSALKLLLFWWYS